MVPRTIDTISATDKQLESFQNFYTISKKLSDEKQTSQQNKENQETTDISIKIGDQTYNIGPPLGCGGNAVVFEVKNEPNIVFKAVRILEKFSQQKAENEIKIAKDLGTLKESGGVIFGPSNNNLFPEDGGFYFIVMPKLYPFLPEASAINDTQDNDWYNLAIKACLAVDQFHYGTTSRSKTPRAHLDIKPSNFLRDKNNYVHLIDFSEATDQLNEDYYSNQTTIAFTREYQAPSGSKLSNQQADILALMRTIYFPETIRYGEGNHKRDEKCEYVFKDFKKMPQKAIQLLDTYDVEDGQLKSKNGSKRAFPSALELAVELTKLKLGQQASPEHVASDLMQNQNYRFFAEEKTSSNPLKYISDLNQYALTVNRLTKAVDPSGDNQQVRSIITSSLPKVPKYLNHTPTASSIETINAQPNTANYSLLESQVPEKSTSTALDDKNVDEAFDHTIQLGLKNHKNKAYLTLLRSSFNNFNQFGGTVTLSSDVLESLKSAFWQGQVPQFFERSNQFGPFSPKNFAAQVLVKYYAQDIEKFKEGIQLFDGTAHVKTLCKSFGKYTNKTSKEAPVTLSLLENPSPSEKKFSLGLFKPVEEATGIEQIRALYKNYKQHGDGDLFFRAAQAIANNRLQHRISGLLRSNDTSKVYHAFIQATDLRNVKTMLEPHTLSPTSH